MAAQMTGAHLLSSLAGIDVALAIVDWHGADPRLAFWNDGFASMAPFELHTDVLLDDVFVAWGISGRFGDPVGLSDTAVYRCLTEHAPARDDDPYRIEAGTSRWIRISASPVDGSDLARTLIAFEDVTEWADRQSVEDFVVSAISDMAPAVAAVRAAAEGARNGLHRAGPGQLESSLDSVVRGVDRIETTVLDAVAAVRLSRRTSSPRLVPTDLVEMLSSIGVAPDASGRPMAQADPIILGRALQLAVRVLRQGGWPVMSATVRSFDAGVVVSLIGRRPGAAEVDVAGAGRLRFLGGVPMTVVRSMVAAMAGAVSVEESPDGRAAVRIALPAAGQTD